MFVAINRLHAKPESETTVEERFAKDSGLSTTPGFRGFQLLKRVWSPHGSATPGTEYLAMTTWDTRDAFFAWTESPRFKAAHSGPRLDIWAAPGEPAGYDRCLCREPADEES